MKSEMKGKPLKSDPLMWYDERISNALYPEKRADYVRARARLEALARSYDFTQSQVVDLGCGRGYFALQLASIAESVLAIDADLEKINRARTVARRLGIQNINFESAIISDQLLSNLDVHDVTLFLAVLHHIINDRSPYEWNAEMKGVEVGRELLAALAPKTGALLFEMGNVKQMQTSPREWIPDILLRPAGFESITVIPPPAFKGIKGTLRRVIHYTLPAWIKSGKSSLSQKFQNVTGYDLRDHRYLFLARQNDGSV